ncbi:hypothetical protein JYB64_01345 [Algoriphagus aestuarii]|nr:hypothetical protein [Algoriphagus aestuarii]
MKGIFICTMLLILSMGYSSAQDANNPIDPSPTIGLWNRFYSNEQSRVQLLANVTYGKWFLRFTAEYEINYPEPNYRWFTYDGEGQKEKSHFTSTNFLVARLFQSKNGQHQFGVGGVISYFHGRNFAGGVNFVSVSKVGGWKFISLATLQGGKEIFTMEVQPGIYHDFNNGWYFRSHPRMLFNFETDFYEVPLGAGIGKIFSGGSPVVNVFFEPQYDVRNDVPMLYMGVKTLF